MNLTNSQLQKAILDQSIGAKITQTITNILTNLTIQLNSTQDDVNNANQVLASDQAQLAINQGNLGPTQATITTAQTTYNISLNNVEAAKNRIGSC